MDFKAQSKGKASPSFSFRYNAEEEEVEQLYHTPVEPESNKKFEEGFNIPTEDRISENKSKDTSPIVSKAKGLGSVEDNSSGETWRIFKEMRGRLAKSVEEKIEEIKSDRMKKKLLASSSLSDSEERSETSSSVKDSTEKLCLSKEEGVVADSDLADVSDTSLTPERTTPLVTEVDISDVTPSKEGYFSTFNTPVRKVSGQIQETEKTVNMLYKKLKLKASKKIELGVEAVEESVGKEIGRLVGRIHHEGTKVEGDPPYLMPTVSVRAAAYFALLGVLYTFVNIPQFLFGVIVGAFLSLEFSFWASCSEWVSNQKLTTKYYSNDYPSGQLYPCSSEEHQKIVYEGWINEFCFEYQPEIYHVTQTETVYARLEGSILKLASPRQKISKRAIWNEPHHKLRFDRERTYDITGCQVLLLPDKLAHKRIWSKKYPICIVLKHHSHLGTRYRERGTPSLDFVSYKRSSKKEDEEKTEEEKEGSEEKTPLKVKKGGLYLDDDEMVLCSDDEDEDDGLSNDYVKVPSSLINKNNIYLFARTDREKDIWFRRLLMAVKQNISDIEEENHKVDGDSSENGLLKEDKKPHISEEHYYTFITRFIRRKISFCGNDESIDISEEDDECFLWFNMFLARILYDPMNDSYWIKQIQEKIQKKLSAIKVPTFMEGLLVSQVELSESVPVIEKSCSPKLNCDGIWVDLDISYKGSFKMAIDTKINLLKLKDYYGTMAKSEGGEIPEALESSSKPAIFDSEVEDSAESSGDEVGPEGSQKSTNNHLKTSQKVLQMVDKIASSKYFQQVTDNKYVKKALEGVSNTTISLVVHVKSLTGTVVLNFPPPPSDRLWYGFRPNTKLLLSAKPRVGQRGINMTYITNYIEKKLVKEFEKILVMPNMDDLIIPLMNKEKPS